MLYTCVSIDSIVSKKWGWFTQESDREPEATALLSTLGAREISRGSDDSVVSALRGRIHIDSQPRKGLRQTGGGGYDIEWLRRENGAPHLRAKINMTRPIRPREFHVEWGLLRFFVLSTNFRRNYCETDVFRQTRVYIHHLLLQTIEIFQSNNRSDIMWQVGDRVSNLCRVRAIDKKSVSWFSESKWPTQRRCESVRWRYVCISEQNDYATCASAKQRGFVEVVHDEVEGWRKIDVGKFRR